MERVLSTIGALAGIFGAATFVASTALYIVPAGHRAVIFDRFAGVKPDVKGEGLHFRVPILQKRILFEIRTRATEIHSDTGTKDLQTVGVVLRILFKPDTNKLSKIFSRLGLDYSERVIPSIGNEVLTSVVAQFDASELITQRETVSRQVRETLTKRAEEFDIQLDDVSIIHLSFITEFANAIEAKQVAQQDAERSRYIVAKLEQEKKAAIIRAEGESEAARLITHALRSGPGFIQLRRIEAAREISETLSKSRGITYIPQSGNMLLNLRSGPPPPSAQQSASHQ